MNQDMDNSGAAAPAKPPQTLLQVLRSGKPTQLLSTSDLLTTDSLLRSATDADVPNSLFGLVQLDLRQVHGVALLEDVFCGALHLMAQAAQNGKKKKNFIPISPFPMSPNKVFRCTHVLHRQHDDVKIQFEYERCGYIAHLQQGRHRPQLTVCFVFDD
jgi:hypothetical protein